MQQFGPRRGSSAGAWQSQQLRRQHSTVFLFSLRFFAATVLLSSSTAPARATRHDPLDAASAANAFLLRADAKIPIPVDHVPMSYVDLGALQRERGDLGQSLPVTKTSLTPQEEILASHHQARKDGIVQEWVWWCIISVVVLMLVLCILWFFCLRGRIRPTLNPPVTKQEDANGKGTPNGSPAAKLNGSNGSPAAKLNGSPPTPSKTPLAVLATSSRSAAEQLCPALIVPESEEMRFALMQNIFSWTPRQASKVLDNHGRVIANAEGTCIGNDRMALRGPNDDLLCEVQRRSLDFADQNVFDIFHPHGQLFGTLEKDTLNPTFTVTSTSGSRLLIFQGDFRRKEIDITDPKSGDQVAQTGHGFFSCGRVGHYQVRVAGGVDAGLVMACCLAIDEAEF